MPKGLKFEKGADYRRANGAPLTEDRKELVRTRTRTGIAPQMRHLSDGQTFREEDYQRMLVEKQMEAEEKIARKKANEEAKEVARQAREEARKAKEAVKQAREVAKQAKLAARLAACKQIADNPHSISNDNLYAQQYFAPVKKEPTKARQKWQQKMIAREAKKELEVEKELAKKKMQKEKSRKRRIAAEAARITKEAAQIAASQLAVSQLAASQIAASQLAASQLAATSQLAAASQQQIPKRRRSKTCSVHVECNLEKRRQNSLPKAVAFSKAMTLLRYVRQSTEGKSSSLPKTLHSGKRKSMKKKTVVGSKSVNARSEIVTSSPFLPSGVEALEPSSSNDPNDWKLEVAATLEEGGGNTVQGDFETDEYKPLEDESSAELI